MMPANRLIRILFFGILMLASFFRFTGINWDQNQHLHPDERFLTMVADNMEWPDSVQQYLDTDTSPLNPHNTGSSFYVYGTFPVIFTKLVADLLGMGDYTGITIVGRFLSGMMDLGTVILVFFISAQIAQSKNSASTTNNKRKITLFPLLSMFLYASSVLPIQLSHFFAVDTYLTFFLTLFFYFLVQLLQGTKKVLLYSVLIGIFFGMAIAAKISAVYFVPVIGLGLLFYIRNTSKYAQGIGIGFIFSVFCLSTIRLALPYLFEGPNLIPTALNTKVLENWKQLETFNDPTGGFPPAVQWITAKPYLFPLKNLLFWGMGIPLGLLSVGSVLYLSGSMLYGTYTYFRNQHVPKKIPGASYQILFLCLFWIILLFGYQGMQFVKALRYFYPLYPFLTIVASYAFMQWIDAVRAPRHRTAMLVISGMLMLVYPWAFLQIYRRPHSRIAASVWIYKNIPAGSTLSAEHWDDALPLSLPDGEYLHERYPHVEFPLYHPDNAEKWTTMRQALAKTDFIVLTSNRLYGSITSYPVKYPIAARFYQLLFDGELGFQKVAEFTSRPTILLPSLHVCLTPPFIRYGIVARLHQECRAEGISLVDDYADETFTVYDHPKVIIFQKKRPFDYQSIFQQLSEEQISP